jgi:catechol 2,3-dioxygenase-like lactoylglutathione lyase family enzyme
LAETFNRLRPSSAKIPLEAGILPGWPRKEFVMKPRITVITVGVDDLERSLEFYRDGLGLKTDGIIGTEFEHGAVVFIDLENGSKLALWKRDSIAHDSGIARGPNSATEFTLGHNLASEAEVDAVMRQATAAGAKLVKPAAKTFWGGYAGYFQDPDGHLWEVLYNPGFVPAG